MTLTELQKHKNDSTTPNQFPGYILEFDDLCKTDDWSRTGVLIKKNIKYKRRRDLETKNTSTVWLQIGHHGSKQFLYQSVYRQFQRPGIPGSKSQPDQLTRWKSIIDKWTLASLEGREIITSGDFNMDSFCWEKKWDEIPTYERSKQPFYHLLKDKILTNGTFKINNEYTHIANQPSGRKTCIDHIYTTHPEKDKQPSNTPQHLQRPLPTRIP